MNLEWINWRIRKMTRPPDWIFVKLSDAERDAAYSNAQREFGANLETGGPPTSVEDLHVAAMNRIRYRKWQEGGC